MPRISIDRLQPGVFVSIAEIGWLRHPFMFNEFLIGNARQIHALQALGLKEVEWIPERSTAEPLAVAAAPMADEEDFGALALSGMLDEKKLRIERVRRRREQFARREREYEKDAAAAGDILKQIAGRPNEAHALAKALVDRVVDGLIGAENEIIQLVNSKVRDAGLAFHSMNVMFLSLMLGKGLGLEREELKALGLGALLHDAGKIEVPQRILRATERTPPEEEFYRAHVGYGIKAVAGARDLPTPVRNIIACHHERFDGSGFPNRLAGEKIPKLARLVAIANRYDNLCNPFDLRQAKTPAEAVAHLFRKEAAHFQPEALQAFVRMLGVYPPGSFVSLSNGAIGLVVEVDSRDLLRPTVMLHDADIPRSEALLLELRDSDLKIAGAVSPATLPVAVVEYLAPRGRLDYYVDGAT
jgi:HD-GYP domain-containing protein (c-di-GMP phosphodiesterase class II)